MHRHTARTGKSHPITAEGALAPGATNSTVTTPGEKILCPFDMKNPGTDMYFPREDHKWGSDTAQGTAPTHPHRNKNFANTLILISINFS